jgi:hypothetical protein
MPAHSKADKIWNRAIAAFAGACVLTLAITAWIVLGAPLERSYSQASPEDVIRSAAEMVKNGDARLLPRLVYADTDDMRGSLDRLGILLGNVQRLAKSIGERFPKEIEKYRADADTAIATGKPPAVLMTLAEQLTARDGPPTAEQEAALRDMVARIFADPYAWISENQGRLTTVLVTDDLASILLDGKPVAGVGLTLKLEGDKWYLALPTNIPPISRMMPKAPEQWRMINSLVTILDNTVRELDDDVKKGRLRDLRAIGDKAQEKVIFPGAIWFAAYASDMDARQRIDRNLRQYRDRQKTWAKSRADKPSSSGAPRAAVSDRLLGAMTRLAAAEIPAEVRARKARPWSDFNDTDFETIVGQWMSKRSLGVRLDGPLDAETVDASVAAWDAGAGKELAPKPKPK